MSEERPGDEPAPRDPGHADRPPVEAFAASLRALRHRGPDLLFRTVIVGTFATLAAPLALPLTLGAMAAILLSPVQRRLVARFPSVRHLAPGVVTGGAVMGILVPLFWIGWTTLGALRNFINGLLVVGDPATRERLAVVASRVLGRTATEAELAATIENGARRLATLVGQWLGGVAKALPEGITATFLFVLALYFGLRDGHRLIEWLRRALPVKAERSTQLFQAVSRSVYGTMLGMLAVACVQGGLATVALFVCRVPHALLWGVMAALASVIPIVGTTPVTIGAATYLLLIDRPVAALGMFAAAMIIGVSDNVVRPWVQSQHDDMHPLLALVAIFGGLAIFGPAGLLLGPVVTSMAIWAVETYRD